KRKLDVLWNLAEYVKTYLELNRFKPGKTGKPTALNKWFLSNLEHLKNRVTHYLERYEPHKANRELEDFFLGDFSRFYIHLVRDKLKPGYKGKDKEQVLQTLYTGMLELLKLLAPFMPFLTERLYQDFYKGFEKAKSIHLMDWPKHKKELVDRELDKHMGVARAFIEAISAARQEKGVKLRWPLGSVKVVPKDKEAKKALEGMAPIIQDMANLKKVELVKSLKKPSEFYFGKFELGPVLEDEALLREVVRKTQILRKENKLRIGDKIAAWFKSDPKTEKVLKGKEKELLTGIDGKSITLGKVKEKKGSLEFKGKNVEIGFEKK
ncbi:MAG: class I tRNA ligase family protein, partial [Candidatus Aenigmatarchaeota archaeon]